MTAAILGIATHLPEQRLTNEALVEQLGGDWTADKIFDKTGIRSRAIAAPDECASDLGVAAAEKLFARLGGREEVDYLLFCTQSPDYVMPSTGCLVQARLKLSTACGAIDLTQGCSGWVYGLSLAKGLVESGSARRVLLITAETYSKFLHPGDRSARTIFGDGAAATLVGANLEPAPVGPFVFGTDGGGTPEIIVRTGGAREPIRGHAVACSDSSGNWHSNDHFRMNGPAVFSFTLKVVPPLVHAVAERAGLRLDEVDYFVFHQANAFMLDHLRRKLAIAEDRFCLDLADHGNTVSSSIPMALDRARRSGCVRPGMRVMLVAFGVGFSWAACMIRVPGSDYWATQATGVD